MPSAAGHGSPTVVFLHGLGGVGRDWEATAEGLKGSRRCWYDRVGVGRSDRRTARHSALGSIEDLHHLLVEVGAEPRTYSSATPTAGCCPSCTRARLPKDVHGVILADATLPFETELDPPGTGR